ncbi:hypothetical protein PIB30_053413 [Stylosanthes scabra]|uniref:Uncharacterized protein n=1 Tax=Stylosanthes scabra TaxID=79078 RepID=A0ABU6XJ20_9FABA|nr:hypothetical protein [Stylosanthes scabra]
MAWWSGLRELRHLLHLLLPLSIHWVAEEMTVFVLVDVTTSALCPHHTTCFKVIYINGLQQTLYLPGINLRDLSMPSMFFKQFHLKSVKEASSAFMLHMWQMLSVQAKELLYLVGLLVCFLRRMFLELPRSVSIALLIFCPLYMQFFLVETVKVTPKKNHDPTLRGMAIVSFFYELGMSGISSVLLHLHSSVLVPSVDASLTKSTGWRESILCSALLASIAYVPYLSASFGVIYILAKPSTYAISAKPSSSANQAKPQTFIAGTQSISDLLSPIAMTPLTSETQTGYETHHIFIHGTDLKPTIPSAMKRLKERAPYAIISGARDPRKFGFPRRLLHEAMTAPASRENEKPSYLDGYRI